MKKLNLSKKNISQFPGNSDQFSNLEVITLLSRGAKLITQYYKEDTEVLWVLQFYEQSDIIRYIIQ